MGYCGGGGGLRPKEETAPCVVKFTNERSDAKVEKYSLASAALMSGSSATSPQTSWDEWTEMNWRSWWFDGRRGIVSAGEGCPKSGDTGTCETTLMLSTGFFMTPSRIIEIHTYVGLCRYSRIRNTFISSWRVCSGMTPENFSIY